MAKQLKNDGSIENDETPSVGLMSAEQFAALTQQKGAEVFAGKRILKLKIGEAAGPFLLVEIQKDQDLSPAGAKGRKKLAPVDVYIATDATGTKINMPVAAAFLSKALEANLAVGDSFAVQRTEDYISKAYGTKGVGYALAIISRGKRK